MTLCAVEKCGTPDPLRTPARNTHALSLRWMRPGSQEGCNFEVGKRYREVEEPEQLSTSVALYLSIDVGS